MLKFSVQFIGGVSEYDKTASFNENLIGGVQRAGVNATVGTAINGGSLSDNLKTNLGSEVLSVASAKLANKIGDAKAIGKLNEFTHKAAHAALGCAGAKIQGKDCGSGAVGAVVGEVIAEQVGNNANLSDSDITAISRVGTAVVAQGLGKDVGTADTAATNAVENNYLTIREQINYAQEMTICGKNGNKCKNDTRKKYQTIYDKNRQAKIAELNKELSKPPFLRNKYKTRQEIEVAINLIKDRPFREEIIKIPEQNLHDIEVISPEEYISRVEVGTIKGVKAVGEAGFSLTVPGRVYETIKLGMDAHQDYKTGNYRKTTINLINKVIPKGLNKIGLDKKIANPIGARA